MLRTWWATASWFSNSVSGESSALLAWWQLVQEREVRGSWRKSCLQMQRTTSCTSQPERGDVANISKRFHPAIIWRKNKKKAQPGNIFRRLSLSPSAGFITLKLASRKSIKREHFWLRNWITAQLKFMFHRASVSMCKYVFGTHGLRGIFLTCEHPLHGKGSTDCGQSIPQRCNPIYLKLY